MAPVDPGPSISWAKNPAYTVSLLTEIAALHRDVRHSLFQTGRSRSTVFKNIKSATCRRITPRVFTAQDDQARIERQGEAVARRFSALAKLYRESIEKLVQDPDNAAAVQSA